MTTLSIYSPTFMENFKVILLDDDILISFSKELTDLTWGRGKFVWKDDTGFVYSFRNDENYCSAGAISYANWIICETMGRNYPHSFDWFNTDEFPALRAAIEFIKVTDEIPDKKKEFFFDALIGRPEADWIKFLELTILNNGLNGIFKHQCEIHLIMVNSLWTMRSIRPASTSHALLKFYKDRDERVEASVVNCYSVSEMRGRLQHFDWLEKNCKKDTFLVETDGFNQCYWDNDKKRSFSTVHYFDRNLEKGVYIGGADDSSFTRFVQTKEEADEIMWKLKRVSPILCREHIDLMGFKFTN